MTVCVFHFKLWGKLHTFSKLFPSAVIKCLYFIYAASQFVLGVTETQTVEQFITVMLSGFPSCQPFISCLTLLGLFIFFPLVHPDGNL